MKNIGGQIASCFSANFLKNSGVTLIDFGLVVLDFLFGFNLVVSPSFKRGNIRKYYQTPTNVIT